MQFIKKSETVLTLRKTRTPEEIDYTREAALKQKQIYETRLAEINLILAEMDKVSILSKQELEAIKKAEEINQVLDKA